MKLQPDGYYVNRHSCFLLQYHLVLVTKYRKPVITGGLESFLKDYTIRYFKERGMNLMTLEMMPDYIHILFEAPPQINLSDFVNAYKSASSRQVRKEFAEELKHYYKQPYFWSLSYFIGTANEKTIQAVQHYIEAQKNKQE